MRYKHVDFYDPAKFGQTYEWLKSWGMTEGKNPHDAFVALG